MAQDDWFEIPAGGKDEWKDRPFDVAERPPSRGFGVRHIMLLVLAVALLFWLGKQIGLVAVVALGLMVLVSAGIGCVVLLVRSGAGPKETMLWLVANAAERGMPLAPGIQAVGELCGGGFRLRANRVADLLTGGASLSEALDRVPGIFPAGGIVYTRMGWEGLELGRALRVEGEAATAGRGKAQGWALRIAFLIWTLIAIQMIFGFMIFFIMPKFEAIFADFGVDLPAVTKVVITASSYLAESPFLGLVLLAEVAILPFLPMVFFDPMHWRVPVIDWWFRRRHGGVVARVLATEVEGGRPVEPALGRLSRVYPGAFVRGRLRRVARRAAGGMAWVESLRRSGLIGATDAAVLASAERVGNLSWALRDVADAADRRFGRKLMAWSQLLFPVVVMGVALVVGVYAAAYFLPLVKLIEMLAG